MMNVYEAIMTRRSTRNYKEKQVEKEKLEKIIEAGRYAPSGSNSQTNHIFVIEKKEVIEDLIKLVEDTFSKMPADENTYKSLKNSIRQSQKGGYRFCYNAPVLIVVANQKDYGNNIADSAIAIENMMLEANELDLGSCYINQLRWLNEEETLIAYMQKLGMKENERIYGSLIIGYANSEDGLPERKALPRKGNEVTIIK